MVQIANSGTEYLANEITLMRGVVGDISSVGVYHDINPNTVPAVIDFDTCDLVFSPDPLAEGSKIDVLSLIGPRGGVATLAAGDYQRWVLIVTAAEDIIRKVDVVTVI
jgi:hypothetical protein